MKQKEPVQVTLFPELETTEAQKPSKKTAKQKNEKLKEENKQLKETVDAQKAEIETLKKENAALQSKASAFDDLVACRNLFPIGTIAKAFGRTAEWLNKYLEKKGIQYKRGEIWALYAQYDRYGYTGVGWYPYSKDAKGRDLVRAHTYWTTKGMAFIREQLIKDGYWSD